MKVLHTFDYPITIHLDYQQKQKAFAVLNLHYLGDEQCNAYVEDKGLIGKYPEKETSEFKESHYNCCRGQIAFIKVELLEDGSLRIKN